MTRVLAVPSDVAWDLQERLRGIDIHVFDRTSTVIVDYNAPVQEDINCQGHCLWTVLIQERLSRHRTNFDSPFLDS
jgi:hypothetical protein